MRRRIERSRARCQQRPSAAPNAKQPSPQSQPRAAQPTPAPAPPSVPLWRAAESQVV
jgi:hypothetical protein